MKHRLNISGNVTKTANRPNINRVVVQSAAGRIFIIDLREPRPRAVRKGTSVTITAEQTTSGETTTFSCDTTRKVHLAAERRSRQIFI